MRLLFHQRRIFPEGPATFHRRLWSPQRWHDKRTIRWIARDACMRDRWFSYKPINRSWTFHLVLPSGAQRGLGLNRTLADLRRHLLVYPRSGYRGAL